MRFWPTVSSLLACVLVAGTTASAQGPRAELNRIREIAVQETPDSTVVVVHGSSNPTFTVFKLDEPPRLFVDIANADVSSAGSTIEVDNGVIGQVGTLQFRSEDKPVGRVIIGLEREAVYNVVADGSDIRIELDGAPQKGQSSSSARELRAEEERVRAAVDRERDLLQQLKLERLKEQRVQEQAAVARKAEEALREQVTAARREAEQARAAEQAKVDALRAEQEALARQITEQQQLEKTLSAAAPELDAQRQAEERRLAELQGTIEAQRERVRAREADLSRALKESEARLVSIEAAYETKQKASSELEAEVGIQEARVRALGADLDREQRRLDEVTEKRQTEEARVASLREELDHGRKELDRVRTELATAERAREGQQSVSVSVQALRSELEAREADVARMADALDRARAAEAEVARLQGELKTGQQALSEREQALSRLEQELRTAREAAQSQVAQREQAIRAVEQQLASARASGAQGTKAREAELARLEAELLTARAAARTEQGERARAVQQLAAELEAARDAARTQQAELQSARDAVRAQQAEREQVEQKLHQEQSARQQAVAKLERELADQRQAGERVVEERDQAISRLESELQAARAAAAAAQVTREDLAKQSKGAQKGDRKRIEKALAAAKEAQTTADRLARELEAARAAAQGAATARVELASAIAERDQKIAALQGELSANGARLAALEAERGRVEEQARKDAVADARLMASKVAALEARLAQERARGGAGSSQVRDLERQLGEERKQGQARARDAEKKVAGELADLQRRLQAAEGAGADAAAIETRYRAQIDRLSKQVEQSESALAQSDGRLEKLRAQQELALQRAEQARAAQEAAAAQAALDADAARAARAQASQDAAAARIAKQEAAQDAEVARIAKQGAAHDAEVARIAKEEARKANVEAAETLQAARQVRDRAVSAPAAPVARLDRIDFRERGGVSRVEIALSGEAGFEVVDQSGGQAVLLVRDVALPAELRRSLDTTDFHSAVTMVSSFESQKADEQGDVRVVVNLRAPVPNRVVRERGMLIWEFEKATALAPPSVGGSQPAAVSAARSLAPSSGNVRYYPNVVSQAAAEPAAAPAAGDLAANPYFERRTKKKRYSGKRINLTIKDADIQHVLTFLAKEGKVNIIAGEDVTGRVTFHLEDIPWDLALDMILKTKGLDYVKEEGIYRVAPIDTIKKEIEDEIEKKRKRSDLKPLFVRLIPVNYGTADSLSAQVKKILSPKGTVTVDKRTNTLIVKDIEDHIVASEDLVRRLDLQTPQVLIEARIVEASSSYTQELGIQWGGNFAMSPVFGNETGLAFPSIVGLSGGATGRQTVTDGVFTNAPGFAVNLPAPVGQGSGGAIGLTLGNLSQSANINLRLSAAEEEGSVKIVSNPKIATLDNRQATIQQGISIPISVVSAQGVNTQFFNAELKLDVTPHVTRDGNVALKIDISKNEPDFGQTGANGNPTIQKKEAHTELLLRDGDTTVIGGIYTRNQGTNYSKVPLLADIPILGWLFKSRRESDQRTELLIFITPRIVNRQASVTQP